MSMGESNTVVSAYTMYRHLQQYCSHASIYCDSFRFEKKSPPLFAHCEQQIRNCMVYVVCS